MKNRLLLHSCCAPCSSSVLERLIPDYDVTVFWLNPNILPEAEYAKRLAEQRRFLAAAHPDIRLIEGEYDPELFKRAIKGFEHVPEGGERCDICIALRLSKTAETAEKNGFGRFCTTLTVSPHKNAARINAISEAAAERYGITALSADFKKKDGFKRSLELSKQYGLYRQNYCGCDGLTADG